MQWFISRTRPKKSRKIPQNDTSLKNNQARSDAEMAPNSRSMFNTDIITIELVVQIKIKKSKLPQHLSPQPVSEEPGVDIFL